MDVFHLAVACGIILTQVWHASANYGTTCPERVCEVQVRTASGPVCGRVLQAETCSQYYSFRGIPYAKPPVGRRRFQAPEPPKPWQKPLYATVEGPACPQRDNIYGHLPIQIRGQSEDCLYLNVHVPASARLQKCSTSRSKGLPVLVFFHGGAFYTGSGNSDLYGPEYLMCKDVIVVVFNYRLGVFGFMSLYTPNIPGNAGLRDQVLALRWVKQNIRAFGGDPDNVTLMGHGTGASCLHLLSLSKATKGLFDRIFILSFSGLPSFYSTSRNYTSFLNNIFLKAAGINSTDPEVIFQQLVTMPLNRIIYAQTLLQYTSGFTAFVPVVEDKHPGITRIIDADPLDLIRMGRGKEYPTVLSYTTDEFEYARYLLLILNTVERLNKNPLLVLNPRLVYSLAPSVAAKYAQRVFQRYFKGPPTLEAVITLLTDTVIKYPMFKLSEWRAAQGGAPVYLHQFAYRADFSVVKYGLWIDYEGAAHIEDMFNVFRATSALGDYVSFPPQTRDDRMKDWMTNLVVNFMRCSNPTCMDEDENPWPAVTTDTIVYQNTNTTRYDVMPLTTEQKNMVKFHDSIDPQSRSISKLLRNE